MAENEYKQECAAAADNAMAFLLSAGDSEVKQFLRLLPVFASNESGPITLRDLCYEMRLQPFVIDAFDKVDGAPGIPGRLLQLNRVFKRAEAEMERLTGERRRLPRVIDVPSFLQAYTHVAEDCLAPT